MQNNSRLGKKKTNVSSKYMAYCLSGKKHTNNMISRNLTMKNNVLRQKSMYSECLSEKSRFLKQKSD